MSDLYSLKTVDDFIEHLETITVWKSGKNKSPSKYIFLLALCKIVENNSNMPNRFTFNEELIYNFNKIWNYYLPNKPGLPEYPYYHLRSSLIWNHKIFNGKEDDYKTHKRFTPKRIHEIIEYAYLDSTFFALLKDKASRGKIFSKLTDLLRNVADIESNSDDETEDETEKQHDRNDEQVSNAQTLKERRIGITSKFPHEQQALNQIENELGSFVELIPNYDLYDLQTNQYLECDLIVVSSHFMAVVEIKHWSGDITVRPSQWEVNGRFREDPHRHNNYKCKVLKSIYHTKFPSYPRGFWVESIVVLTNPAATVYNGSKYDNKQNNPTFACIRDFVKHVRHRINIPPSVLSTGQIKNVAGRLREMSEGPRHKGLYIPGFKILKNLTESPHRIEVLAQPVGNQLDKVKRLRIFSFDLNVSASEREKQRYKALNSLKALNAFGDHPNILKVWDVYHEDGLVIEASDWSETEGTLAHLLRSGAAISKERALAIIRGIASGLEKVHDYPVIHRNLEPENIMIFGNTPKLMNFDLSYIPEDNRYTVLPDDLVLKTSPYLAPELYTRKTFYEATDLFSLGVIAYELFCGKTPFKNVSTEIIDMGGSLNQEALAELKNRSVPEKLYGLIDKLIQHDQKARPQTAKEVLAILDDLDSVVTPEKIATKPNATLQPEDTFGFYAIEKLLGIGREAQVYLARKGEDQQLALKLFNQDILPPKVQEIEKRIQSIDSPYVVRCFTSNQWSDGRSYLHLELLTGGSFRQDIEDGQRPDMDRFKHVVSCLMSGVQALHQNPRGPILHNDIKPDNILFNSKKEPVIIDFGTSSAPQISPYMGTGPYIAPDLFQDADYDFCESSDLFALAVTVFEWLCGQRPYGGIPDTTSVPDSVLIYHENVPSKLVQWFVQGVSPHRHARFATINAMQTAFEAIFRDATDTSTVVIRDSSEETTRQVRPAHHQKIVNPFVTYLNTLHNTTADNDGALAETQAISPFFGFIHVPSPLSDLIFQRITASDGGHVILTGHAGDGKSTIALEVLKRLRGIPMSQKLEHYADRERIEYQNLVIHIVKDMSEIADQGRQAMIQTAAQCDPRQQRWLIISNTGALLKTFKGVEKVPARRLAVENAILTHLKSKQPEMLEVFGATFLILNLTQIDNTPAAVQLLEKILFNEQWDSCKQCDYHSRCPLSINQQALAAARNIVTARVGRLYRRLYEYGKRLTMRQISAHLAYSLTAGLDCWQIRKMMGFEAVQINEYLFYNRFMGFKGAHSDDNSLRLKAVQYLLPLELGARPFPKLERELWINEAECPVKLPEIVIPVFDQLKQEAHAGFGSEAAGARLRQEIRRMFYILGDFEEHPGDEKTFTSFFCDTPMLWEYESWQYDANQLVHSRRNDLKNKILRVLQEQFVGFHLPEQNESSELFITVNRRNEALRQTVQILLARIPFINFELILEPEAGFQGVKRQVLILKEKQSGVDLSLELPFLDFVITRSTGVIGQQLNQAYLDRLERFKAALLYKQLVSAEQAREIQLLEFTEKGRFRTQKLIFDHDTLQVMAS